MEEDRVYEVLSECSTAIQKDFISDRTWDFVEAFVDALYSEKRQEVEEE